MKILIAGGHGQLGSDLNRIAGARDYKVEAPKRSDLDITSEESINAFLNTHKFDIVVNCAAYTAVDKAESEAELAFAVNHDGAANLARACTLHGLPLVHISTDYVFNGEKSGAYVEDDVASPLGVYGESKWQGEQAIRQHCSSHLILRIAWVFGVFGHNFVKTMQRLALERDELRVVNDQYGCPSATRAVSHAIIAMAEKVLRDGGPWGTYHYSCQPSTDWYEFAREIVEETAKRQVVKVQTITPISTQEYPTPAMRPKNSVLNCDKIRQDFGISQADWREELRDVVAELEQVRTKQK
ncbi:MAG: dTDP-4-dehydrorhamnose reductase [Gammaproteobacteria bacterium]|nr:dTDP-4-dehydrorhamnose reductase [Gammaproteobacteria bacterium]